MAGGREILVLGTGTFAQEIADVVSEIPGAQVVGFVENLDRSKCDQKLSGLPVYWVDELERMAQRHEVICGLGTTQRDRYIRQAAGYGARFATLVHPTARISAKSKVGDGSFVSVGVIVAGYSKIGEYACVNRGVLIGHHTRIGEFVTVGPGANVAGNSRIGDRTYIGTGAVVIDHVSVGAGSLVGAGAVVTRDVPDRVQVVGVPAKIIRENIENK